MGCDDLFTHSDTRIKMSKRDSRDDERSVCRVTYGEREGSYK